MFQPNVNIYQLNDQGKALSVFKSMWLFGETMYLNLYKHQLLYVSNFLAYAPNCQCVTCEQQSCCEGRTKLQFPWGFYIPPKTIFDKLEERGVSVPPEDRLYKLFLVYDLEAYLEPSPQRFVFNHRRVPISVSVCNNVYGYDIPYCTVEHAFKRNNE